jgi:hypothetical protein
LQAKGLNSLGHYQKASGHEQRQQQGLHLKEHQVEATEGCDINLSLVTA